MKLPRLSGHPVPRFSPEALKTNQALVTLLDQIAKRRKVSSAQIAIGWLLAQKPWIVPIPGTTKIERLKENIGGAEVNLTPADLREIEMVLSKIQIEGARFPESMEKMTGL